MASNQLPELPRIGLSVLPTSNAILFFSILLSAAIILLLFRRGRAPFPPSPPKIPIIGNLHQLRSPPHRSLAALARRYGPLMLLQLGRVQTLVVSSAEMAEEVLKTQDLVFASRPKSKAVETVVPGGNGLAFAPYGELWRRARKIAVVHLLSSHRVQELRPAREVEVARLVRGISEKASSSPDSAVDMSSTLSSFTCSFICRAALGLSGMEIGGTREIADLVARTMTAAGGFRVDAFFPWFSWLGKFTGTDKMLAELARRWLAVHDRVLEAAAADQRERRADERGFLDVLLALRNDDDAAASIGLDLSPNKMKAIIQTMITAGTDTSYLTLEAAMEELIKNPVAMKKAQDEVRAAVGQDSTTVTEDDICRMSYLKAVIKETLRLHPPVPLLLPHQSMKATRIRGFEIPAKVTVLVNAWAIARDPEYWPSPEQFRPERFLQSSVDFWGSHFQFIPFGAGRRMCPGTNLAVATVELTLANLLYHFDWSVTGPADLDLGEAEGGLSARKKRRLVLAAKPYHCQTSK